jgi:hypothetical protein
MYLDLKAKHFQLLALLRHLSGTHLPHLGQKRRDLSLVEKKSFFTV